ncbi:MAG: putative metal-binding motif-containing protein [Myxococcota bacterium]
MILWSLCAVAMGVDLVVGPSPMGVYASVTDALRDANDGDRILLLSGTYVGSFVVADLDVVIESVEPRGAILQPDDEFGHVVEGSGAFVTLRGVVIDGRGTYPGFWVQNRGHLQLSRVEVRDVKRASFVLDGAAVAVSANSSLSVVDSEFESGHAADDGGFIAMRTDSGALTVSRSRFRLGIAEQNGGAIYCNGSAECRISESTFEFNIAGVGDEGGGGALWVAGTRTRVERSRFCDSAAHQGGATYAVNSEVEIIATLFDGNRAILQGGGLFAGQTNGLATQGNAVVRSLGNVWRGNLADRGGGGFFRGDADWIGHGDIYANNASSVPTPWSALEAEPYNNGNPSALLDWNLLFDFSGGTPSTLEDAPPSTVVSNLILADPQFLGDGPCDPRAAQFAAGSPAIDVYSAAPDPRNPPTLVYPDVLLVDRDGTVADLGLWSTQVGMADADEDGFIAGIEDCDDANPNIHPGATETVANGTDEDCDGGDLCFADPDGDGVGKVGMVQASTNLSCAEPGEASVAVGESVGPDDEPATPPDSVDETMSPQPDEAIDAPAFWFCQTARPPAGSLVGLGLLMLTVGLRRYSPAGSRGVE